MKSLIGTGQGGRVGKLGGCQPECLPARCRESKAGNRTSQNHRLFFTAGTVAGIVVGQNSCFLFPKRYPKFRLDPVGKSQGKDGELEVRIRRSVMIALDQMKVIIDPVRIHFSGQFIEMDSQFGKMSGIVGEGAFAFAGNDNFLFKLGKQFGKTCYIRTGSLDEVFLFLS
ncbi:hypothetical protein U3A58_19885 [Algoriphagus sp. C2-6-M1]|uniref:hypothetical protein n=1 Tax=Algoriphagus persicinus TaxID=3108754 RepID=UPI002B3F9321|nr:hypothetical protein [Algoriphagus sp. C2-6-M1]MEB2782659.1 hypothetical protein [Algoriphagus sp. C2-6-M1]